MMIQAERDKDNPERSFYILGFDGFHYLEYLLYPYGVLGFRTPDSLEKAANDD